MHSVIDDDFEPQKSSIRVVGEARNVMLCSDNSPLFAVANRERFVQVTINEEWHPKTVDCSWECREGFL